MERRAECGLAQGTAHKGLGRTPGRRRDITRYGGKGRGQMLAYFRPDSFEEICRQESFILERCKEAIHAFEQNAYKERGIAFRVFLAWNDALSGRTYEIQRPAIRDGYMSFVCWQVLTAEGKIVESEDHDMYMDFAMQIGGCRDGVVWVDDAIVNDELHEYRQMVEDYLTDPY